MESVLSPATIYKRGLKLQPGNIDAAIKNFIDAAKQRYVPALLRLGWLNTGGDGYKVDRIEAGKWYLLAYTVSDYTNQEWPLLKEKEKFSPEELKEITRRAEAFWRGS